MAKKSSASGSGSGNIFAQRRERLMKSLDGAIGLVFAGDGPPPLRGGWRTSDDFYYLTGINQEAGAAVLLDPANPDASRRSILFLRPLNPEADIWDGLRDPISAKLRSEHGFPWVMRTTNLPRMLTAAAKQRKTLACLHQFAVYDAPVSQDLATFRKVSERVPGVSIIDRTQLLPLMRAVKDEMEIGFMDRAAAATAAGFAAATKTIRPGVTERDVQRALENGFASLGGHATAYDSIVGTGRNGAVLHYHDNIAPLEAGQLLVIDAGAEIEHYACDVTRTYPVSGKFTAEQREIYELVLKAQEASINAARAGAWMYEVDGASRAVFEKAGVIDQYPHGTGHQLGLNVHDATPDGPLMPGMVITIEPGLYDVAKGYGIRIEDDILITAKGNRNLTAAIPKSVKDVEAAMR